MSSYHASTIVQASSDGEVIFDRGALGNALDFTHTVHVVQVVGLGEETAAVYVESPAAAVAGGAFDGVWLPYLDASGAAVVLGDKGYVVVGEEMWRRIRVFASGEGATFTVALTSIPKKR